MPRHAILRPAGDDLPVHGGYPGATRTTVADLYVGRDSNPRPTDYESAQPGIFVVNGCFGLLRDIVRNLFGCNVFNYP
jgi:hypothetical protein